jgi:hypothetical protein
MTRPAPATSEAPAPSEPIAPSGQLLRALLSSAGLSVRGDVVSAPAGAGKKKPARLRRAPAANR